MDWCTTCGTALARKYRNKATGEIETEIDCQLLKLNSEEWEMIEEISCWDSFKTDQRQ